ncbi:MAG: VOC family protein, partial [Salinimicrobium sp.]
MKIEFLKLYTRHLRAQKRFYTGKLQLPLINETDESFQLKLGYTLLEFEQQASATPYHIAIHIPAFQVEKALEWLEKRTEILRDGEDEIIDFPAWKARSVYFYDADQNIVEFISRRDFFPASSEDFSEKSLLGISEIGLATDNVEEKFNFLNRNFGLRKFTGDYERFCATGDDEGLFIIINKGQKDWIPTGDKAYP